MKKLNADKNSELQNEIAFLAIGVNDYWQAQDGVDLSRVGGFIGLLQQVIVHAPLLVKRWSQISPTDFDGVWLYDVTRSFGYVLAGAILSKIPDSPADILESIVMDKIKNHKQ